MTTPQTDRAALHSFVTGSPKLGEYQAAQWQAWEERRRVLLAECRARGLTVHLTGSKAPGAQVHAPITTLLGDVAAQLAERWPDPTRVDGMSWSLMEAIEQVWLCALALDAADRTPAAPPVPAAPNPAPTPTPSLGWKTLPAPTVKLSEGDTSSYQHTAPRWTSEGMRIDMPARGEDGRQTNPDKGAGYQRCEITIVGQGGIRSGPRVFRFVYDLDDGFPIAARDWQVLAQWKGDDTGSPPLSLEVRDGVWMLTWHKLPTTPNGQLAIGPARPGRNDLVIAATFSTSKDEAPVSAWLNGTRRIDGARIAPTLYPGKANRLKVGLYRSATIGTAAGLTLAGCTAGATLAAVTG